jgi:hypothetical protein
MNKTKRRFNMDQTDDSVEMKKDGVPRSVKVSHGDDVVARQKNVP